MAFADNFNFDEILYRNVIVGLLDFLNRKVQYQQVEGPAFDDIKLLSVPYFFEMNGDERFLQDFYMNYAQTCDGPGYAEGNYDPIPRGINSLQSLSVNSSALTNKFVRGTYNKQESEGSVKAYSANINVIPVTMSFGIEVHCSNYQQALKITQQTIATFYKAGQFAIDYNGMRIIADLGFPEDYPINKPIEFSYPDKKTIILSYSIDIETYQPVIDPYTSRFRGNIMDHGIGNVLTEDSEGTVNAILEIETRDGDAEELRDSNYISPDRRAPYGYDVESNPQYPENQPE